MAGSRSRLGPLFFSFAAGAVSFAASACTSHAVSGPTGHEADSHTSTLTLQPGDVAELSVTGGVAGATFAPSAGAEYVVVMASTKFDSSAAELPWSIDTTAAPAGARAQLADGCSLSSTAWSSVVVPAETPPSGTTVAEGTTKTLHA